MSFTEQQIQEGDWYEIDSSDGTYYLDADLGGDSLEVGEQLTRKECDEAESSAFDDLAEELYTYTEVTADQISSIKKIHGFGARLSAPGYMDRTEWSVFDTEQEAKDYLEENYGDDESEVTDGN